MLLGLLGLLLLQFVVVPGLFLAGIALAELVDLLFYAWRLLEDSWSNPYATIPATNWRPCHHGK